MKTVGIITEYNPLHNGHIHHINETKRLSNCDTLICVMSGNFTQRGEPAIIDKFTRTSWAIQNGVDLVIELPFVFTVQNADIFAYTSVSILDELGVDEIYFGSESGNIEELMKLGDIVASKEYNKLIKEFSKEGNSYPTSSDLAMRTLYPNTSFDLPNNILGIQYILSGKKRKSGITFHTIKRISTNYYDEENTSTTIQSATAIRKLAKNKDPFKAYVPSDVHATLTNRHLVTYEDFYTQLQYIFHSSSPSELRNIFNINEGLEHRLLKITNYHSTQEFIDKALTRRYTNSKIKRCLAHILCKTPRDLITSFEIPYLRVLGMNDIGRTYLSSIKKELQIPLISKVREGIHPYLDHEIKVSRVYDMVSDNEITKQEFKQPIY